MPESRALRIDSASFGTTIQEWQSPAVDENNQSVWHAGLYDAKHFVFDE